MDAARPPEITWPQGVEEPRSGLRRGDDLASSDPAGPPYIARVRLGDQIAREERLALVAPPGSRYRYSLVVPAGASLRFGVGVLPGKEVGGAVEMQVRLGARGSEPKSIYVRRIDVEVPARWRDEEIDLAAWSEEEVVLELAASAGDSGGALGAWSSPSLELESKAAPARPNVIWISLDTLRSDHLGSYGYSRPTSPALDGFAARGLRFRYAISQAPWTRPSHRSMLTGVYPASRGGLEPPMIGAVLYRAGYQTFAVTGGGQVDSALGFDRGFEIYRVEDWLVAPRRVIDWARERSPRPFFLFLHTYEIHEPYTHTQFAAKLPAGRLSGVFSKAIWNRLKKRFSDAEKRYAEALYDGDIAHTDSQLAELFAELEATGLFRSSIVIVTSDHGEQFWENGTWGHGQNLHDHQIHVPLLIYLPEPVRAELQQRAGKSKALTQGAIADQVELIDLYPTLLDLLHIPLESPVNGRSLVPLLAGQGSLPPRAAFAERTNVRDHEQRALRTPLFKFIVSFPRNSSGVSDETYELYDLQRDPREQTNLAPGLAGRVAELRSQVDQIVAGGDTARDDEVPAGIDDELRSQLEALGYVGN